MSDQPSEAAQQRTPNDFLKSVLGRYVSLLTRPTSGGLKLLVLSSGSEIVLFSRRPVVVKLNSGVDYRGVVCIYHRFSDSIFFHSLCIFTISAPLITYLIRKF
jgi:hypothetical protein